MSEHKPLYPWSKEYAEEHDERDLWRESHKENCDCARAIERAIAEAHDYQNHHLNDATAPIIERYGFDRVNFVLASTIQEKSHDGRFSHQNKEWANSFYLPADEERWQYCVDSHPGLANVFLDQVRSAWNALGLHNASHCESENDGEIDYTDRVLVLKPSVLKDEYKTPDYQLFLAEGGFGCSANARGRKIFGQFLKDGEKTYYQRSDFIGVLKDEYLPEWAAEKLDEINPPEENEDSGMTMQ